MDRIISIFIDRTEAYNGIILLYRNVAVCGIQFPVRRLSLFPENSPLYARIIVMGMGCSMIGRTFEALQLFLDGGRIYSFNVGLLGIMGTFLFFFTANFGQMDAAPIRQMKTV